MFKIAWLYYDILNLYGDSGNMLVLQKILSDNQIPFRIDKISLNDYQDLSDYDIIFLGGGSDSAQQLIYHDLLARKAQIVQAMEQGGFVLAICGGYQLFGKHYVDMHEHYLDGLNIFDYETKAGAKRLNGNLYVQAQINDQLLDIVGYENHSGNTFNVTSPFARVVSGHGNSETSNFEGCLTSNFLGTYVHGPLLPKNPEIGAYIIDQVLKNKYQTTYPLTLNFKFSQLAKEIMIKRLTSKE